MSQYLLATYYVSGEVIGAPTSRDEMEAFMGRVMELEEEMVAAGTFLFGGALRPSAAASVVGQADLPVTDGPFAESKEQIAGFYIIEAEDDAEAQTWARKVADATNHPIEVRPFAATGLVKDHQPGARTG